MRRRYRSHSRRRRGNISYNFADARIVLIRPVSALLFFFRRHEASHRHHRPAAVRLHGPAPGGQRPDLCRPRDLQRVFAQAHLESADHPHRDGPAAGVPAPHLQDGAHARGESCRAAGGLPEEGERRPYQPQELRFVHDDRVGPDSAALRRGARQAVQVRILLRDGRRGCRSATSIAPRSRCSAIRSGCCST